MRPLPTLATVAALIVVSVLRCPSAAASLSCDAEATALQGCAPLAGLSGGWGASKYLKYACPQAGLRLTFKTYGGRYGDDSDLYVKFADCPTTSSYDGASEGSFTCNETVTVASSQVGTYYILVYGYTAYANVTVEAQVPPAFDTIADAKVIDSTGFTDAVSTRCATSVTTDPALPCGVPPGQKGNNTVWYRYTPSSSGQLQASCVGSDYETVLVAWRDNAGVLESVACDHGLDGQHPTISFAASAGQTYYLEVASRNDGGGSLVFSLSAASPANLVATKTASPATEVRPGDTLTYTITITNNGGEPATGCQVQDTPPTQLSYVPQSTTVNGVAIPDGPNGTCPLATPVSISASGSSSGVIPPGGQAVVSFRAVVGPSAVPTSHVINTATISAANTTTIQVASDTLIVPAFDRCSEAEVIPSDSSTYTGDYGIAAMEACSSVISDPFITGCAAGRGYHTAWFRYTPSTTSYKSVRASLKDQNQAYVGVILAVWQGGCGGLFGIDCAASLGEAVLDFQAAAGVTYYIEVASQTPATGAMHLSMGPVAGQFSLSKTVNNTELEKSGNYVLTYELRAWSSGAGATECMMQDTIPSEVFYIPNTTTLNGAPVEDVIGASPLEMGMPVNSPGSEAGIVREGQANAAVVTFQVRVPDTLPDNSLIKNTAVVSGTGAAPARASVEWFKPPHFDNCAEARTVAPSSGVYSDTDGVSHATRASKDPIPSCTDIQGYKSVWYTWTSDADQLADVDARIRAGGNAQPCFVAVYTGDCATEMHEVGSAASADLAYVRFHAVAGTTYLIEAAALTQFGETVEFHLRAPVQEAVTIAQAKAGPTGARVVLDDVECTGTFGSYFYVEDPARTAGIRVNSTSSVPARGARLTVTGTVSVDADHECVITAEEVRVKTAPGPERVKPLCLPVRMLGGGQCGLQPPVYGTGSGLNNVGLLVRVVGVVRRVSGQTTFFYLDDGTLPRLSQAVPDGIRVYLPSGAALPPEGSFRALTGICSVIDDGGQAVAVIRMRSADELEDYSTPPATPVVTDSGIYTTSTTQLTASWSSPSGGEVAEYLYAIGTGCGQTDVRGWTSIGLGTFVTATGLTLVPDTTYHFSVKARGVNGLWSGVGCSDGVTVARPLANIVGAKSFADGSAVHIAGKPISVVAGSAFWIEEPNRLSGIKVNRPTAAQPGTLATVTGRLATSQGERMLDQVHVTHGSLAEVPEPLATGMLALGGGDLNSLTPGVSGGSGPNNIGLRVRVWGRVTALGTGFFYVDDGSAIRDGTLVGGLDTTGVRVESAPGLLAVGDMVIVTGASSCYEPTESGQRQRRIIPESGGVRKL